MLLFFISQYWQNDKNELLRRNAESISALTQKSLVEDADTGTYYISNRYVLQGFLSTFSDSSNADIFITDVQGKTLLCSEGGNCIHTQRSIPDKIMKDVLNNGFVSTSNLGGIYPYSHFTVGVPVTSGIRRSGRSGVYLNRRALSHLIPQRCFEDVPVRRHRGADDFLFRRGVVLL